VIPRLFLLKGWIIGGNFKSEDINVTSSRVDGMGAGFFAAGDGSGVSSDSGSKS
jgi:hypothetical protein